MTSGGVRIVSNDLSSLVGKALVPLIEARAEAQATALYAWLLYAHSRGESTTLEAAAEHFGKGKETVRKWRNDLVSLGVVELAGERWEQRMVPTRPHKVSPPRRGEDGKIIRCRNESCRRPAEKGAWCWGCRQKIGRVDRWWWSRADKMLRQGMTPTRVQAMLDRERRDRIARGTLPPEAPVARLWDHVVEGQQQPSPGIVSRGLELGVLPESWRERQREALSGADDDF